ncbi:MAG: hypothetical protein IT377_13900, partial [Polyangiaceae bacterium]|nr:hypothetical protein [Polyangiaceae bacterium]
MKRSLHRATSLAAIALSIGVAGAALASRSGSDRDRAEALLAALSRTPAHARLAHEPMTAARRSLDRANEARAAGDEKHAPEIEGLAREQAESGADLVRAAEAEKKLAGVQKELSDVETKLGRARALLEEALARRGRAQAKLEELEKPKAVASPPAALPKAGAKAPKAPPAVTPKAPPAVTPKAPPAVTPKAPPAVTPKAPPAVTPKAPPAVTP